jgi:hypothetical protein
MTEMAVQIQITTGIQTLIPVGLLAKAPMHTPTTQTHGLMLMVTDSPTKLKMIVTLSQAHLSMTESVALIPMAMDTPMQVVAIQSPWVLMHSRTMQRNGTILMAMDTVIILQETILTLVQPNLERLGHQML